MSNVRFIDAHAQGYRGHDDIHIFNTMRHQVWTSVDIGDRKSSPASTPIDSIQAPKKAPGEYAVFAGAGGSKAAVPDNL
jgi:hypothetical protein